MFSSPTTHVMCFEGSLCAFRYFYVSVAADIISVKRNGSSPNVERRYTLKTLDHLNDENCASGVDSLLILECVKWTLESLNKE
jgi:hypothetical protein